MAEAQMPRNIISLGKVACVWKLLNICRIVVLLMSLIQEGCWKAVLERSGVTVL